MEVTKQCRDIEVNESILVECETMKQAQNVTRRMTATTRLPGDMKNMKYSCAVFTGISLNKGDIIYINKVTRIK